MYREFYGIHKKPFQISADPEFLWLGSKHMEGLSILIYGVRENKGFLVLSGGVGTGKTTLVHALLKQLDDSVVVASVPDPGLELIEFYRYIAASFGMQGEYKSKVDFLFDFEKFLKKKHAQGRMALLILDEAQRLSPQMLEEVRLLSNIETPEQKLLNIFFVGQEEIYEIIATPQNRALRQRITINYHLTALSLEETRLLIEHRLKVAGSTKPIFSDEAIASIYNHTDGHPRRINVLCDHALLTGFVKNNPIIDTDIITECIAELRLPGELSALKPLSTNTASHLDIDIEPMGSVPQGDRIPPSPQMLDDAVADEMPRVTPSWWQNRNRIIMVATTICLAILAAVMAFKPQRLINPSVLSQTRVAAPQTGTAQAESAVPELEGLEGARPTSLDETAGQSGTSEGTLEEALADAEPLPPATWEQTTATAPLEHASDALPETLLPTETAESPIDFEAEHVTDIDTAAVENDRAVAAMLKDTEDARQAEEEPAVTMSDAVDEARETSGMERTLAESASIEAPPAIVENLEPNAEVVPGSADQAPRAQAPGPLEVSDDFRMAKATTEPTESLAAQTSEDDAPTSTIPDESIRSAVSASSESKKDAPEVLRPDATLPASRPAAAITQPEESESTIIPEKKRLTDKPPESDRSGGQASAESSAPALVKPRPAPESTPQPPPTVQPAPQKTVRSEPLVAAADKTPRQGNSLNGLTTTKRLDNFLTAYCSAYSNRDLEQFTAFFTTDATERNKPFTDLIPVYRATFKKLDAVRYQINMQTYTESADGREIQFKGDFQLMYHREGKGWGASAGLIEMDLVKLDNGFRIKRLDYKKRK